MPAKRKAVTLGLFDLMQRHPAKQSATDCADLGTADEIRLRAAANEWIGETFQFHRRHLAHTRPAYCDKKRAWAVHKVGGWAVIFCAQAQIGQYADILADHKFNSVVPMVWRKTNPVPFNHKYKPINSWEALVAGKRPGTKFNGRAVHNVFTCKSPSPQQRIHPTQKPLPLMREFVRLFSSAGGLVWGPFGGAATTLIAAVQEGRRAVAYEKDWVIYQRAKERVMEACVPAHEAGEPVAA